MSESRHILTIEPAFSTEGAYLKGHLVFDDGTEMSVLRDERAQVIAWAQTMIEKHYAFKNAADQRETLILDHAGEIVREPLEWSVRAR